MAVMQSRDNRTYVAGSNLSAAQFKFVALAADGEVDVAGAGARAIGVLLNQPAAGNAATVVMTGKVLVEAGDSITAGDELAADAAGNAVTATTDDIVMGYALENGVDGQIVAIELIQGGNAAA
jgi:hypothetical protein